MFDLRYTRDRMLRDIHASDEAMSATDPDDSTFQRRETGRLEVCGYSPAELLPGLNRALRARFADVPAEQVDADLTYVMKKGIGNAWKWGNRKDPTKRIAVEVFATNSGSVVVVTDEGEGFDAEKLIRRLEGRDRYFSHGGSGLRHFKQCRSIISYDHGGRTLLIRFLRVPEPGRPLTATDLEQFGRAGDGEFMRSFLGCNAPGLAEGGATLIRCRTLMPEAQKEAHPEIRYVLEYESSRGSVRSVRLTGRLLPPDAARSEWNVGTRLFRCWDSRRESLQIPRPVAHLRSPGVVIFDLDPLVNLRRYLKQSSPRHDPFSLLRLVGSGLSRLHESDVELDTREDVEGALDRYAVVRNRIVSRLKESSSERVRQVRALHDALVERAAGLQRWRTAPVHGQFGWNCVFHAGQRLWLYYFDQFRLTHPGFDVGGFLADLLRFDLKGTRQGTSPAKSAREAFLGSYFGDDPPAWRQDLPFFTACGQLVRIDRFLRRGKKLHKVGRMIDECEAVLAGR